MTNLRMRIAERRPLTERIATFRLESADGSSLPSYQAGAHIRVALPDGGDRAYSLIDFGPVPASPSCYLITVQKEPEGQGGSLFMHRLEVGDQISVTPPKCDFPLHLGMPALLLAGGIGITPIISMAAALAAEDTPFALHYAGRSRALMAYADRLVDVFGRDVTIHCDDEPETVLQLNPLLDGLTPDWHLYICGPRGLIEAASKMAGEAGIGSERVHVELFSNTSAEPDDVSFEVELASTGQVFVVEPDRTIIETLEDGGVDLVYDCQRGDCGICQTGVISGTPDHRDVVLSETERAAGDVMQICVSRAKSPRLVLDL